MLSSKTVSIVSFLLALSAKATKPSRDYIIQATSDTPGVSGYLVAQEREPTYGSIFVLDDTQATPFYFGGHGVPHSAIGRPRYAEQTADTTDSRVYFTRVTYGKEVGDHFSNVTCTLAPGTRHVTSRALTCVSGDNTLSYVCTGTGESSGWFMYNPADAPNGPTYDPTECGLVDLTAIFVGSKQAEGVKLVSIA